MDPFINISIVNIDKLRVEHMKSSSSTDTLLLPVSRGEISYHMRGKGPPVLLIIGYLARYTAWESQIDAFSKHFTTLAFDHIGLGESRGVVATSMKDFTQDCLEVIQHFQWEKIHVVGVSMGGMIAQEFTLRYPRYVQSLTLIVTHPGGLRCLPPPVKGWPFFIKAQLARSAKKRIAALSHLLIPPNRLKHLDQALVYQRLAQEFTPRPPSKVRLSHLWAIIKHNTQKRLSTVKCPTLIIQAQQDYLVHPRGSIRLKALIPHSQFLSVAEAGHGVIRQDPSPINESLLTFLLNHTPSKLIEQSDSSSNQIHLSESSGHESSIEQKTHKVEENEMDEDKGCD